MPLADELDAPEDPTSVVNTSGSERSVRKRSWARRVLLLLSVWLVVALGAAGIQIWIARPTGADLASIRGVRLGMTADQIRARFADGAPATWRTDTSARADLTLIREPAPPLDRAARFELHAGMLVAMRFDLPSSDPDAAGPVIAVTPASVISRTPSGDGRVRLVVLARNCPTHAAEVSSLLRGRR